jgi:hypothetical protein
MFMSMTVDDKKTLTIWNDWPMEELAAALLDSPILLQTAVEMPTPAIASNHYAVSRELLDRIYDQP